MNKDHYLEIKHRRLIAYMQIACALVGGLLAATAFPAFYFQTTVGGFELNNVTFALILVVLAAKVHLEIIETEKDMNPKKQPKSKDEVELKDWHLSLGLVLLASLICIYLFYFVPSWKDALVLHVKNPSFWQFFTSAFEHMNEGHLIGNLQVFVLAAILQIYISEKSKMGQAFLYSLVAILIIVPIAGSILQVTYLKDIIPNYENSMGFSGVAAATLGLIPFTLFGYLFSKGFERKNAGEYLMGAVFLNAFFYTLIYAVKTGIGVLCLLAIIFVAALLFIIYRNMKALREAVRIIAIERNKILSFLIAVSIIIFVVLAPILLYPDNPIQNGSYTDFITHGVSLLIGIYVGYFAFKTQIKEG